MEDERFISLIDRLVDKRLEIKLKRLEQREEKEDKLMMMEEEQKPFLEEYMDYQSIEINV